MKQRTDEKERCRQKKEDQRIKGREGGTFSPQSAEKLRGEEAQP